MYSRCGHCKNLKPEYGQADLALKDDIGTVQLALFDADAERDFANQFDVKGYPTIKVFEKGHAAKDASAAKEYVAFFPRLLLCTVPVRRYMQCATTFYLPEVAPFSPCVLPSVSVLRFCSILGTFWVEADIRAFCKPCWY